MCNAVPGGQGTTPLSFLVNGFVGDAVGGGVRAEPMGGDMYRVTAQLNARSSASRLQDFLLLKAAETALENGAVGFELVSASDDTRRSLTVERGMSFSSGSANVMGNSVYGQSMTMRMPDSVSESTSPVGRLIINLVREPAPEGLKYVRAQPIVDAIGPRLKPKTAPADK